MVSGAASARPRGLLFLCAANSARSQMAEGITRSLAPAGVKVRSAGSRPTDVRPEAIAVLEEIGIDISSHRSKPVAEIPAAEVGTVITLCGEVQGSACCCGPASKSSGSRKATKSSCCQARNDDRGGRKRGLPGALSGSGGPPANPSNACARNREVTHAVPREVLALPVLRRQGGVGKTSMSLLGEVTPCS